MKTTTSRARRNWSPRSRRAAPRTICTTSCASTGATACASTSWRTLDRRFDWFELVDGVYRPRRPNAAGLVDSRVFPGLRLAVDAVLNGDLAAVMEAQRGGLAESAHAAFVERLQARRG